MKTVTRLVVVLFIFISVCPQLEAAGCDPLDELYDALAGVVGTEDTNECYKSYLLVLNDYNSAYQKVPHSVISDETSVPQML